MAHSSSHVDGESGGAGAMSQRRHCSLEPLSTRSQRTSSSLPVHRAASTIASVSSTPAIRRSHWRLSVTESLSAIAFSSFFSSAS
jgi:hypothetical protein